MIFNKVKLLLIAFLNFCFVLKDDILKYLRIQLIRLRVPKKEILFDFNRIVILAPHPDDEVFGCSGLIQKMKEQKKIVYIIYLTSGERAHHTCCDIDKDKLMSKRRLLAYNATKALNIESDKLIFLHYPDGGVSLDSNETNKLRDIITNISPNAIFLPNRGDLHKDHVEAWNIGVSLAPKKCLIYEYCVWFWYNNIWNINWKQAYVVKMNRSQRKAKKRAISEYLDDLAPCGHPWSGILPRVFIKAHQWKKELFFRVK